LFDKDHFIECLENLLFGLAAAAATAALPLDQKCPW
jgi:hypothetical protein